MLSGKTIIIYKKVAKMETIQLVECHLSKIALQLNLANANQQVAV